MQNYKLHGKISLIWFKIMRLRDIGVVISVLVLAGCGTGVLNKAPKQLTIVIENTFIQPTIALSDSEQLDVVIKNNTNSPQVVKMQGLKINFVTQPVIAQSSQSYHFQIEQNKGSLLITSTDDRNQTQSITVNIE